MPASVSRRRFLHTGSSAGLAVAVAPFSAGAGDETPDDDLTTVSIIHTTDLHGHIRPTSTYEGIGNVGGFARCASLIREWKRQNPNHLLVDAGDLYQGTHVSRQSRGKLMIKLLNAFNYNAWVLGNHEFDWGIDPVAEAIDSAGMATLGANLRLDAATIESDLVKRWHVETIDGFRIGFLGLTTPGLPYWLNPKLLGGIEATDPATAVAESLAEMNSERNPHAVVSIGHMGTKRGSDDYANHVHSTIELNEDIDIFIGGHTHRDYSSYYMGGTIYTQANYWGIHLGRIDLTFSKSRDELVDKRAFTVLMDRRFEADPLVMELSSGEIEASEAELDREIGELKVPLDGDYVRGRPNGHERLISAAIAHSLVKKKQPVDAVFHGPFFDDTIQAQTFSVRDVWNVIPYENQVVTAELTAREVVSIVEEAFNAGRYTDRNLMGLEVKWNRSGSRYVVTDLVDSSDGEPLSPEKKLRIAFNSYDAQSAGRRLMGLRDVIEEPSHRAQLHEIETRECLIDFFLDKKEVTETDLVI